jgi:hypothetical protein
LRCQASALAVITFNLLAPDTQAVRETAKLGRNRFVRSWIAGIIDTVPSKKPNATFTQLGRIGGGMFFFVIRLTFAVF